MTSQATTTGSAPLVTDKQKKRVLLGLLFGMLLGALDQTIVGTAMPKVIASFGGMDFYAWVFTAYMLVSTTSVPVFGKLGDLFGRKYFYIGSLSLFMLGSALCGAAQNMTQLIIFRGIQGLGAGSMMANAMAIIGDIFSPAERGRYQGLMGAVFGLSSVVGPALGGYLTDNLSWRWTFYVNIPVGLVAIAILALAMPRVRFSGKRSIDYAGVATLLLAVVPMLLAFTWAGKDYAWRSQQIIGLLVLSLVFWVFFVMAERRASEPILPMDLFGNSIFSVSSGAMFLSGAGMFGAIMFIPLFMQAVIGMSATNSGMLLTPMMLAMVFSSVIGGQVISRTGKYKWLTVGAFAVMAFGMYLMAQMNELTSHAIVVRNMIIMGMGLGVTMPVFTIAVQNSVAHERLGVATAAVQFFRSIGGTIGVAVFGTFLSTTMRDEVTKIIPPQMSGLLAQGSGFDAQALMDPQTLIAIKAKVPQALWPMVDNLLAGLKHAIVLALQNVFWASFAAIVVCFVLVFFLKEIPLRKSAGAASEGSDSAPEVPVVEF